MAANIATFKPKGGFGRRDHFGLKALAGLAAANDDNPVMTLRSYSPLPRDAQEIIDNEILKVGRDELVIAATLLDSVSKPLPNWLSLTTVTSQRAGEAGRAQVGMVPNTRGERQIPDLAEYSVPVFSIWDDYEFDIKTINTAQRVGYALDTTSAEQATRNVNEKIEDVMLNGLVDANGDPILVYGLPVYGLLNAPNASTYPFETNTKCDDAAKTGSDILTDVIGMLKLGKAAHQTGPWTFFIPTSYGFALSKQFTAGYPATILSMLLQIPNVAGFVVADSLPDDTVVMFNKKTNSMDVLVGMLPTSFSWATNPQMPFSGVSSMVAAVVIPRPKYSYNNETGIVVGTPT